MEGDGKSSARLMTVPLTTLDHGADVLVFQFCSSYAFTLPLERSTLQEFTLILCLSSL